MDDTQIVGLLGAILGGIGGLLTAWAALRKGRAEGDATLAGKALEWTSKLAERLDRAEAAADALRQRVTDLERQALDLQAKLAAVTQERDVAVNEADGAAEEIAALRDEVQRLSDENAQLRVDLASERQARTLLEGRVKQLEAR